MSHLSHPLDEFHPKVMPEPNSGCWLWLGATNGPPNYGVMHSKGKAIMMHRVFYKTHVDADLPDSLFVCHRCDNPICVNPAHLFAGTPADNMADKVAKGRQATGARAAPKAKLTADQVIQIRKANEKGAILAARYGISQSRVSLIRAGKSWKWLSL